MEREIKFRGKTKKTNKWVFGELLKDYGDDDEQYTILVRGLEWIDGHEWCGEVPHDIQQDTIGQFTNCYDKTDLPIYEGDIVEWDEIVADGYWRTHRDAVKFVGAMFYPLTEKWIGGDGKALWLRVIGNVYEDKELLED